MGEMKMNKLPKWVNELFNVYFAVIPHSGAKEMCVVRRRFVVSGSCHGGTYDTTGYTHDLSGAIDFIRRNILIRQQSINETFSPKDRPIYEIKLMSRHDYFNTELRELSGDGRDLSKEEMLELSTQLEDLL